MPETIQPLKPVDNWQQVRDQWVAEANRFVDIAETWSKAQGWGTLRDDRSITEDRIGSYRVPVLLIHTMKGRLLLSPEARFAVGADGLFDLNTYPSFDNLISIVRVNNGWRFKTIDREVTEDVNQESFVKTVNELVEHR
jgi:hypothetical protein